MSRYVKKKKKGKAGKVILGLSVAVIIAGLGAGTFYLLDQQEVSANENGVEVETLQTEIEKLNGDIEKLDAELASLKEEKEALLEADEANQEAIEELNATIEELETQKEALNSQISELEEQLSSIVVDSYIELTNGDMEITMRDINLVNGYADDVISMKNGVENDFVIVNPSININSRVGDSGTVYYINSDNVTASRTFTITEDVDPFDVKYKGRSLSDLTLDYYVSPGETISYSDFTGISNLKLYKHGQEVGIKSISIDWMYCDPVSSVGIKFLHIGEIGENDTFEFTETEGRYVLTFSFDTGIIGTDANGLPVGLGFEKKISYNTSNVNSLLGVASTYDDTFNAEVVSAGVNEMFDEYEVSFNAFGEEGVSLGINSSVLKPLLKLDPGSANQNIRSSITVYGEGYNLTTANIVYRFSPNGNLIDRSYIQIRLSKSVEGSTKTMIILLSLDDIAAEYDALETE